MSLIECVPNISEGRDSDRRRDVCGRGSRGPRRPAARLLRRSVPQPIRLHDGGRPTALEAAVLALVARAVGTIDLRSHRGEHPRVGAVDVVPFVPLDERTMSECVELARACGRAIAERLDVPVYLYEEASTNPARRPRGHPPRSVRRAGGEDGATGMGARFRSGRPLIRPPGATVVGARATADRVQRQSRDRQSRRRETHRAAVEAQQRRPASSSRRSGCRCRTAASSRCR